MRILCKIVSEQDAEIWNSDWLKGNFKNLIDPKKVINIETLYEITPVIEVNEVELFKGYW